MSEQEQEHSILVNYDKKEYVVLSNLPRTKTAWASDDLRCHPLPLLTALGNNRGSGDYYDKNPDFDKVGRWAKDRIGVLQEIPDSFTELKVIFEEVD